MADGAARRYKRKTRGRGGDVIDTQSVEAPSGRAYGERQASEQAQGALPLPDSQASQASAMEAALAMTPPQGGSLTAPSTRPSEPVTAGMARGAGPGPEAIGGGAGPDDLEIVRALYRQYPSEALRKVLERLDRSVGADRPLLPFSGQAGMPPVGSGRPPPGIKSKRRPPRSARIQDPYTRPDGSGAPIGAVAGDEAGWRGSPTGTRTGRITAREQIQGDAPPTDEG